MDYLSLARRYKGVLSDPGHYPWRTDHVSRRTADPARRGAAAPSAQAPSQRPRDRPARGPVRQMPPPQGTLRLVSFGATLAALGLGFAAAPARPVAVCELHLQWVQ